MVHVLRRLVLKNRKLAGFVLVLALAMKLLVPAGFMPTFSDGRIVVSICSGTGPTTMVMTIPGLEHGKSKDGHQGKAEQPCAFAGLSAPSLAAADPMLLAIAIAFAMALALQPITASIIRARPHLRPPLRGPPASF
jgi:hypothetical protein